MTAPPSTRPHPDVLAWSGEPAHPLLVAQLRRFTRVGGVGMVLCGVLVLVGWWLGMPGLTRLMAGATTMKAISAIGFILSGLGLLACSRPGLPASACKLPSVAVTVIGILAVAQYMGNVDLGIDHLFPDPEAAALGRVPGRMSQMTAVGFILLGVQGLLPRGTRWALGGQVVAVVLMGLATLALAMAGYAHQWGTVRIVPVAAPTALLFLVGSLGWLALQTPSGIMALAIADSPGGALLRRLVLPVLLLPPLVAIGVRAAEKVFDWSHGEVIAVMALLGGGSTTLLVCLMAFLLHRLDRQKRRAALLHDEAHTDALTGLLNRRAFDEEIERLLQGHRGSDTEFALLMLDLDRFKSYNDSYGHLVGDEVLRLTGEVLRMVLRPRDIAARYGGEEFAVLLPGTGQMGARRVAERLRDGFHAQAWPHRAVTVSIGIALARPGDTEASLVGRADAALYQAKDSGRDRACEAPLPAMAAMQ